MLESLLPPRPTLLQGALPGDSVLSPSGHSTLVVEGQGGPLSVSEFRSHLSGRDSLTHELLALGGIILFYMTLPVLHQAQEAQITHENMNRLV